MTSVRPAAATPAEHAPARQPPGGPAPATLLPAAEAAARLIGVLQEHPCWSASWDKAYGVWRVAEDDPDSGLYAESSDADTVISYIQAHA
jgi:hypothetical protein